MIMKKVLMFMAIMIAVVSLSSCNSFEDKAKKSLENKAEDSFENKAKKQLHATMKEVARNPKTYKITNEKVIFSNDSMCTISFIGRGQNGFGGYSISRMEYTFIKERSDKGDKIGYRETLLNMENEHEKSYSIKTTIGFIKYDLLWGSLKKKYDNYLNKGLSKEDAKAEFLYDTAIENFVNINGRHIGDDNWAFFEHKLSIIEDLSYPQTLF